MGMPAESATPSARTVELTEAAYRYALTQGLGDLSLRPLATAIGTSPRVLLYLFGSKERLIQALLARARADELAALDRLSATIPGTGIIDVAVGVWDWLADEHHRPLLRLWLEGYARSLIEPHGAWAGFAAATVHDWLALLAAAQPAAHRDNPAGRTERTIILAILRGALLDLLATEDTARITAAVRDHLAAYSAAAA
jgi:AcrR family transcriptional regulator